MSAPRDSRIDVWRGLCLVDVVLVHLAYNGLGFPHPLDDVIKHYTRFAAGGFVFLAGLTVAVVFGPAAARGGPAAVKVYDRLLRRAGLLVLVDVLAAVALRLLDAVRAFPADPDTPLEEALHAIAFLQRPGVTGGILLLYALLLALMPLVFELRRLAGNVAIVLFSAAAYLAAIASDGALAWPPYDFPLLYWQPLFFAGFVSVPAYEWVRAGGRVRGLAWAVAASLAFAVVFATQYGAPVVGQSLSRMLPLDFSKTPLQPGALLWYFTAVNVVLAWSHVFWHQIARSAAADGLALLGRHSLLVYTAHVFTEIPVLEHVWSVWPETIVRVSCAAIDVLALTGLALAAEMRLLPQALAALRHTVLTHPARWARVGLPFAFATTILVVFLPDRNADEAVDVDPLMFEPTAIEAEAVLGATPIVIEPAVLLECPDGEDCVEEPWHDGENSKVQDPDLPFAADVDAEPI